MKIYRTGIGIIIEEKEHCFLSSIRDWDEFINRDDLFGFCKQQISGLERSGNLDWLQKQNLLAPVGSQEIWAAGVTYLRSKQARMEESEESGGASFYDKVYDAERPELFYKSAGYKAVGPGATVRIRKDSTWDVPEPELTLVVNSSSKIIGYTIGNDMSSRSIEGENPLYLPQAKQYDKSAAIGPCVLVMDEPISLETGMDIIITRKDETMYQGNATLSQMKRKLQELVDYLFRENSFPKGVYLMTGTCLVPGNDFTLQHGDRIEITIEGIGTLINTVE